MTLPSVGQRAIRAYGLIVCAGLVPVAAAIGLGLWRRPPGWLSSTDTADLHALRWTHDHLVNAVAITAELTVVVVVVTCVQLCLSLQDRRAGRLDTPRYTRYRAIMLRQVRHRVVSYLEPSLVEGELTLSRQLRPDLLDLTARPFLSQDRRTRPLPPEAPILKVFEEVGGAVLIVGAAGAGKTTLLLQLAEGLLDNAESDPSQPIPVAFNLASWAIRRKPLGSWIVDELQTSYNVPRRTGDAWIKADALALLLDGLDEVAERHRADCVKEINAYRRGHGLVPMAVCCSTREIEKLTVTLSMDEAVELLPLADPQVDVYLNGLEGTGTTLADFRAALNRDQSLREVLRTPLMLHAITLAYRGRPASATANLDGDEWRRLLWASYIKRMFERRPLNRGYRYTQEQAVSWLGWLARALYDRDQVEFHLDRLTADWLPEPQGNRQIVFGRWLIRVLGINIQPAEKVRWSWSALNRRQRWLVVFIFDCIAALVVAGALRHQLSSFLILAGLLFGDLVWLMGHGVSRELRAERAIPNEGVRWSARNGLIAGVVALVLYSIPWGAASGSVGWGLLGGLGCGIIVGLSFGGWGFLKHYAVRMILIHRGVAPRRYNSFLKAMADRQLLRGVGSGYLFTHRLLRDYLASAQSDQALFIPGETESIVTTLTCDPGRMPIPEGDACINETTVGRRANTVVLTSMAVWEAELWIADKLQIEAAMSVVSRHQERYIGDIPWSLQTSFYPMSLIERGASRLIQPSVIDGGVVKYLQEAIGAKVSSWCDTISVRIPSDGEMTFFKLLYDRRVWVFDIVRTTFDETGTPLFCAVSVYPTDRNQLAVNVGRVPPEITRCSDDNTLFGKASYEQDCN